MALGERLGVTVAHSDTFADCVKLGRALADTDTVDDALGDEH